MRINTNVSAMMAANNLSTVQNAVSDSMEKLSSGFRINKAADDAAGLGIANTLRADGLALSQASRNADQTTSLLQVAEGGTSTIESILERMKELATQSASDTVDAAGRQSINAEFTALRSEIDRTVSTTTFQGGSLLDGTFGTAAPQLASGDVTFTGGTSSTATAGAYTISVSTEGIATLNRPSGSVPPTYSVDLTNPTAGQVTYANGKASITFGTVGDDSAITVAATAASGSDIAGIQTALDAHGFTITGAVAAASTTGTSTIAGATVNALPSSLASSTLHITLTNAAATPASGLTASSYITNAAVGAQQAADTYTLHVASTDAAVDGTGNTFGALAGISSLAVGASQTAGGYTVKLNGSNELEVMHGTTSLGVSSVLNDASVAAGGNFSIGGVSFTLKASGSGGYADLATLSTAINGSTGKAFSVDAQVRTLTLKNSSNVTVGAAQDFSSFDGSANIAFNQGGISFDIDKSTSFSSIAGQLDGKVLTVTGAHADLENSSNAVLATQDMTGYSDGSDVTIAGGGYSVTLAGVNAATNTYAHIGTAVAAGTITATHQATQSASAGTITGNGSATKAASFMVDSSGQYKTNDMLQLQALDLTVSTLGLTNSDLSTASGAQNALTTIDAAMGTVTTALGSIGANQNRINYAQDNLKTKIANFASAESVIRDVDMADEMTTFSKNQILAQAGTAMLAQANQSGQSVLKLLQ